MAKKVEKYIQPYIMPALGIKECTLLLYAIGMQDTWTDKQRFELLARGGIVSGKTNPFLLDLCKKHNFEATEKKLKELAKAFGTTVRLSSVSKAVYEETFQQLLVKYPTYEQITSMIKYATIFASEVKKDTRNIIVYKRILKEVELTDEQGNTLTDEKGNTLTEEIAVEYENNLPAIVCTLFEKAIDEYKGDENTPNEKIKEMIPPFILNNSASNDSAKCIWGNKKREYVQALEGVVIQRKGALTDEEGNAVETRFCVDFSLTPNQIKDLFTLYGQEAEYEQLCNEVLQRAEQRTAEVRAMRAEKARYMQTCKRKKQDESKAVNKVSAKVVKSVSFTPNYSRNSRKK